MYRAKDLNYGLAIAKDGSGECSGAQLGNIKGNWDDDNIGGHNVDQDDLKKAGLETFEEMEGYFTFEECGKTREEYAKLMDEAGFVYNKEFEKESLGGYL